MRLVEETPIQRHSRLDFRSWADNVAEAEHVESFTSKWSDGRLSTRIITSGGVFGKISRYSPFFDYFSGPTDSKEFYVSVIHVKSSQSTASLRYPPPRFDVGTRSPIRKPCSFILPLILILPTYDNAIPPGEFQITLRNSAIFQHPSQ
jgi:hypothetical protein